MIATTKITACPEDIQALVRLSSKDKIVLELNPKSETDCFYCELDIPANIKEWQDYVFFSEEWKDENSPQLKQYTDVTVFRYSKFKKQYGRLYHFTDTDTGLHTLQLFCYKDETRKEAVSNVPISEWQARPKPFKLAEFVKLIKHPLAADGSADVKEPIDSYDFSVVNFETYDKTISAHLEYSLAGKLYFEILDQKDFREGEFIRLDDSRRQDVICNIELTEANVYALASKIDKSLSRFVKKPETTTV